MHRGSGSRAASSSGWTLNESGSIHWSTDAGQKKILRTAEPIFGLHSVLLPLPVDWKYVKIVIEQDGKTRNLRLIPR